jgi:hypothetical protein
MPTKAVPRRTWTRGLRGPHASWLARGALTAALVLGMVGMLAAPGWRHAGAGPAAAPATLEERVARLEGIIDPGLNLAGGLHTLEWLVGLSMACPGFLLSGVIGVAVGRLMEGGYGRRR